MDFEHGGITSGDAGAGSVGVVLRSNNFNLVTADYNANARFEFFFLGGGTHYQIVDGAGVTSSGIPFTDGGLRLKFILTGADTYNLEVTRLADSTTFAFNNRTLGGTAGTPLESFSLYNRNAEDANVYFNSVQVIPEPGVVGLLGLGGLMFLIRRRRQ